MVAPGESLQNRTLNAGVWAFALKLTVRLLRTARTIVLARILAPDDFGLMAIAILALSLLQMVSFTGFDQALIQRTGDITDHLNTAWVVAIVRGVLIGVILALGAPLIATFFNNPAAAPLVRVMAISVIVSGFKNVGVVYFDKELEFRQRFVFRSVPALVELAVAVSAALILRNVWALVIGVMAARVTELIASYVAHPYRPRFVFKRARAVELLRFGAWMFLNAIMSYIFLNIDDIFVGRVLGTTDLGFYTMAFTLSSIVSTEVTGVINLVAFPAYAKLQDSRDRLRSAYLRTVQVISLASFPMAAGMWFVAPTAVGTFMGDKWLPLLPAFNVLLLWGLLRAVGSSAGPVLKAVGRPDIPTKGTIVLAALLAATIYPFTVRWGITGAAWATVVAGTPVEIWVVWVTSRYLQTERWAVGRLLAIPAVSTGIMLAVLVAIKASIPAVSGPWILAWAPLLGVGVYVAGILTARRFFGYAPDGILRSRAPSNPSKDSA